MNILNKYYKVPKNILKRFNKVKKHKSKKKRKQIYKNIIK